MRFAPPARRKSRHANRLGCIRNPFWLAHDTRLRAQHCRSLKGGRNGSTRPRSRTRRQFRSHRQARRSRHGGRRNQDDVLFAPAHVHVPPRLPGDPGRHACRSRAPIRSGSTGRTARVIRKPNVYTFNPTAFVLPDLAPPAPKRKQFRGDLFRGHFESPPEFPAEPSARLPAVSPSRSPMSCISRKLMPHPDAAGQPGVPAVWQRRGDLPRTPDHRAAGFRSDRLRQGHRPPVHGRAAAARRPGSTDGTRALVRGALPARKSSVGDAPKCRIRRSTLNVKAEAELYFMERELAEA